MKSKILLTILSLLSFNQIQASNSAAADVKTRSANESFEDFASFRAACNASMEKALREKRAGTLAEYIRVMIDDKDPKAPDYVAHFLTPPYLNRLVNGLAADGATFLMHACEGLVDDTEPSSGEFRLFDVQKIMNRQRLIWMFVDAGADVDIAKSFSVDQIMTPLDVLIMNAGDNLQHATFSPIFLTLLIEAGKQEKLLEQTPPQLDTSPALVRLKSLTLLQVADGLMDLYQRSPKESPRLSEFSEAIKRGLRYRQQRNQALVAQQDIIRKAMGLSNDEKVIVALINDYASRPIRALNQKCSGCEECLDKRLRCSKCKKAYYCGPDCQREHWAVHKLTCQPAQAPDDATKS